MTTSVDLTRLNTWSAENLYYPDDQSRYSNCPLSPITSRTVQSSFTYRNKRVYLPANIGLDVFVFPVLVTRDVLPNATGWINGSDLITNNNLRLIVADANGRVVPLNALYVLFYDCQVAFLAIDHRALIKTTTVSGRTGGLTLTYENILSYPVTYKYASPIYGGTPSINTSAVQQVLVYGMMNTLSTTQRNTSYATLWVNGQYIANSSSYVPAVGDYLEVFVASYLDVLPVHVDDNTTGYASSYYASYREILHLKKIGDSFDNAPLVIPHDVIEVIIYDTASGVGQLFTRYSAQSIRQITHRDWSIDRTQIEAIKTSLGSSDVSALVLVSTPSVSMNVINDVNYMNKLYQCPDNVILNFLQGGGNADLSFWKASYLEQSYWLSLLYSGGSKLYPELSANSQNLPVPAVVNNTPDINFYMQALGYYNTATVLSSGIRNTTWYNGFFTLSLPRALMGKKVYSYIFDNGRKILDSNVTTVTQASQVNVTIGSGSYSSSDNIQAIVKDASGGLPQSWQVSSSQTTLTVTEEDFSIYQVSTSSGLTTYTQVPRGTGTWMLTQNADGSYLITAYPQSYGQSWVYYPSEVCSSGAVSLDNQISNRDALWFDIQTDNGFPLLTLPNFELFLNGYWLVNNIDYVLIPKNNSYRVMITNRNFLRVTLAGNTAEWYITSEETVSDIVGYSQNQIIIPKTPYVLQPTLSEFYANGLLDQAGIDKGTYFQVDNTVADGSVCEVVLRYPLSVMAELPHSAKVSDDAKIASISNYFSYLTPTQTGINQTIQHQVYSPWLQSTIRLVVLGLFTPINDPSDTNFINQFPDPYGLKAFDPTLVDGNAINRQFVSVAASYTLDITQTTAAMQAMIQRLITLTLNRSTQTLGVTPV